MRQRLYLQWELIHTQSLQRLIEPACISTPAASLPSLQPPSLQQQQTAMTGAAVGPAESKTGARGTIDGAFSDMVEVDDVSANGVAAAAAAAVAAWPEPNPDERVADLQGSGGGVTSTHNVGIIPAKIVLNRLHKSMTYEGFSEVFVDQRTNDVLAVTRHRPMRHDSYVLIAHSAFQVEATPTESIPPLPIAGRVTSVVLEARLVADGASDPLSSYRRRRSFINALEDISLEMRVDFRPSDATFCRIHAGDGHSIVHFVDFRPGTVLIMKVELESRAQMAVTRLLREIAWQLPITLAPPSALLCLRPPPPPPPPEAAAAAVDMLAGAKEALYEAVRALDLVDLNLCMYRCGAEERDATHGAVDVYDVPDFGPLVYCGFEGVTGRLADIRSGQDLGHPLCENLRRGDWLMSYLVDRLRRAPQSSGAVRRIADIMERYFAEVKLLPRYLIPWYAVA